MWIYFDLLGLNTYHAYSFAVQQRHILGDAVEIFLVPYVNQK